MAASRPTARGADADDVDAAYRLAAAGREAAEDDRLTLLEQLYDPVSRRRRAPVQPGWRCLEVAAGRGSMAVWLAEQVGPAGQVVATDIDTRYRDGSSFRICRCSSTTSSRTRSKRWSRARSIWSARA